MTDPAAVLGGDPGRPVSASKIPFPAAVVEREVRARLMPYSGCRAAVICELARAMSDAVALEDRNCGCKYGRSPLSRTDGLVMIPEMIQSGFLSESALY
jgi:hypothetical protein